MRDKTYFKIITFIAIGVLLTWATWWSMSNHRKASSNSQQLIGRWKLLSGGFDRSEVLELREDGTMTTSAEIQGKQTVFDGKYRVGSRHITLTVLLDRHSGADDDDEPEKQPVAAVKGASSLKKTIKEEDKGDPPEVEEAEMQILSISENEIVIAETNGHRMIYMRL